MNLQELARLAAKATPGPYFAALDTGEAGPHTNSGLMLVDTGRQSDWPIARLCETNSADYIAACTPERISALVRVAEAAISFRNIDGVFKLIAAIRDLEATP